MSSDKQVLVVDSAGGPLQPVMDELGDLGFRVIWTPTLSAALEFVAVGPRPSLIVASSSATAQGGLEFLARLRDLAPDVRIIWGVNPEGGSPPSSGRGGASPDSLIPEPMRRDELRGAISALLAEHFYPAPVATAVEAAALEVLGHVGFTVEGGAFLVANQTALSHLSAVITFSGDLSGHLLVGLTREDADSLYRAFLPRERPVTIERMEDLVGELCNQILGRINAFFVERSLSIQHGTPIFIRAPGSTLRYPGRQPSFAVTLVRGETRVSLEYYLAHFERARLQAPVTTRILKLGEVRYF
jgi:CheY-specific phosphatase CheX/CheY-like chemotaxis protein